MILVTGQSDWGGIHSNVKSLRDTDNGHVPILCLPSYINFVMQCREGLYMLTPKVSYSFVVSTSADGLPIPDLRLPPPPCAKCSNGSPPKNMTLVSYLCNTYERCA